MDINLRVTVTTADSAQGSRIEAALAKLQSSISILTKEEQRMQIDLTGMAAAVAAQKTIDASAMTLFAQFSTQLSDLSAQLAAAIAANDETATKAVQAAIDSLRDNLDNNNQALAASILKNTPHDPNPGSPVPPIEVVPPGDGSGSGSGSDTPPPPPSGAPSDV